MKRLQKVVQDIVNGTLPGVRCEPLRNRPVHCLIVEDDESDAALSVAAVDAVNGVTALLATTKEEAINLLSQSEEGVRPHFDFVFCDLKLQGSTDRGCEVIKQISQRFPKSHTIVVSGHFDSVIVDKLKGCYVGFISKPLQADNLDEILKKHRLKSHDPVFA